MLAAAALFFQLVSGVQALPAAAASVASSASAARTLPEKPQPGNAGEKRITASEGGSANLAPDSHAVDSQASQSLSTIRIPESKPSKASPKVAAESIPSRRRWLALSVLQHGAAAFDAYSTNLAVSRGATEQDPFLRPFSGSPGMYAAIQAGPVALDFLARHMQRSEIGLLRRAWWVPQSASAALFLFSGVHNLGVSRRP